MLAEDTHPPAWRQESSRTSRVSSLGVKFGQFPSTPRIPVIHQAQWGLAPSWTNTAWGIQQLIFVPKGLHPENGSGEGGPSLARSPPRGCAQSARHTQGTAPLTPRVNSCCKDVLIDVDLYSSPENLFILSLSPFLSLLLLLSLSLSLSLSHTYTFYTNLNWNPNLK